MSGHLKVYNIKTSGGIAGPVLTIQTQDNVAINSVSMHPFTSKVAAGLWNGNIEVYELDNGKRVSQQLGWTRPVSFKMLHQIQAILINNFVV